MTAPGKKLNCPAQVVFTEIILLPEYKVQLSGLNIGFWVESVHFFFVVFQTVVCF